MTTNSKGNPGPITPDRLHQTGTLSQWGGKLAFFFTYTHLSHDLTTGLLAALLPFIRQDLGLDYLQAGLLVSAFALSSGLAQFLGGWLSDRINRKRAIALGLGGVGLSAVAIGFTPSYYILLAVLVFMGIMAGLYHPSAVSVITNHFEVQRRGRAMALHLVGGSLGFAIGPFFGAIIASRLNWHLAFIILGLPALAAVPLVLSQLKLTPIPEPPRVTAAAQGRGRESNGIWPVFRSALGIIVISIAMQLISGPVMSFIPLFLVDVHHFSEAAGSTWLTVVRLGGLAGSLAGGWLADRWGRRKTIFLSLILFGPVVLLLAKLPFSPALAFVLILFGWLISMRETVMQTYLMDNTPPQLRATVFGIYFGFGQQGSSIIQPVAGDFMDTMGITTVFNGFGLITIGLSVLTVIFALRNTQRRGLP